MYCNIFFLDHSYIHSDDYELLKKILFQQFFDILIDIAAPLRCIMFIVQDGQF